MQIMLYRTSTVGLILLGIASLGAPKGQAGGAALRVPVFGMWMDDPRPLYRSKASQYSPSYPDTVDIAFGALEHIPPPDLEVANFQGPDPCELTRIYTTPLALAGIHEVGMTVGWRTCFSYRGTTANASTWSGVRFEDPKGASQEWIPNIKDGVPTGDFPMHPGCNFILHGEPSSETGKWNSLTWQRNGAEKWVFLPLGNPGSNVYRLAKMVAFNGSTMTLKYDETHDFRLTEVDSNDGKPMITIQYGDDGLMASATDRNGVKVYYSYSMQAGYNCLTVVSPRCVTDDDKKKIFWRYGYEAIRRKPFLTTVSTLTTVPNELAVHRNIYDPVTGKETCFVDADGTRATITYKGG